MQTMVDELTVRLSELGFPTLLCRRMRLVLLQSKPRLCELGFPTLLCRRVRLVLLQSKPRLSELGSC